MLNWWRRTAVMVRRIFRILVLFAVLRLLLGVAIIVVFEREAIAWGYEATLVVAAACVIYVGVAFCLTRRFAPAAGV